MRIGCRDSSDDKLLETALMRDAALLVTSEKDLLDIGARVNTPILTPKFVVMQLEIELDDLASPKRQLLSSRCHLV